MIKHSDNLMAHDDGTALIVPGKILLGWHYQWGSNNVYQIWDEEKLAGTKSTVLNRGFAEISGAKADHNSLHDIKIDKCGDVYLAFGGGWSDGYVIKMDGLTQRILWKTLVNGKNDDTDYWSSYSKNTWDGPTKLAFSPDHKYIYACGGKDGSDKTIHKLQCSNGTAIWRTGTDMYGSLGIDVKVDTNGYVYVAYVHHNLAVPPNSLVKTLRKYDPDDGSLIAETAEGRSTYCIAFRPGQDYFYVGSAPYSSGGSTYNFGRYEFSSFAANSAPDHQAMLQYFANDMISPPGYWANGAINHMTISPNNELVCATWGTGGGMGPTNYLYMYDVNEDPADYPATPFCNHRVVNPKLFCMDLKWFYGQLWLVPFGNGGCYYFIYVYNVQTGLEIESYINTNSTSIWVHNTHSVIAFYNAKCLIRADTSAQHRGEEDCGCFLEPQYAWISNQDYNSWNEGQWLATTDYGVDAEVTNDDEAYWGIQANGPGTPAGVIEPGVTSGWESYWYLRERYRLGDIHASSPFIYDSGYRNGVWKFTVDDCSGVVNTRPLSDDYNQRLSFTVPRPFSKWHKWIYYYANRINSWVVHNGSYYKCKLNHGTGGYNSSVPITGYYEPGVTSGWATYWELVSAMTKDWDDYNGFGGEGNCVDKMTTPQYYTLIIAGYTDADFWKNGIYYLQKQKDAFDGVWMCQRRRIGVDECDIELRLGEPDRTNYAADEIITLLDVDFAAQFDDYDDAENYVLNNQVNNGGIPYVCLVANGPGGVGVKEPGVTSGWETYWKYETEFSALGGGLNKSYSSGEGYAETNKTNPGSGDFHGCVYEAHNITVSGVVAVSWYPGAAEEWDPNKTYASDIMVVHSNRFYKSTMNDNTGEPGIAGWTILSN